MIRKALLFVLVLTLTTVAFGDWETVEDHWYGGTIAGAKSGWMHSTIEQDGSLIRTTSKQKLEISRGGTVIEIAVSTEFVETTDGKPISVHTLQEAMGQVSESTWKFIGSEIEITSVAGGVPVTKKVSAPKEKWLTPRAVDRYFKEQLKKGAAAITYQSMSPELGIKIFTVIMTKLGEEVRKVIDGERKVTSWKRENDAMPISGVDSYDESGTRVESVMNAGFGEMVNTLMSKQAARSTGGPVPELMVSQFIEPNKEIPNDPSIGKIKMIARSKDNTLVSLPSCGFQSAKANPDGSCTIVVNLTNPTRASSSEKKDPKFLAQTSLCDGTDVAVIALAKKAVKDLPANATDRQKAEAMREFVNKFITSKEFGKAFASASQVARDPAGDCSEHGVLLCGLLRASGIPSRGVMGIVYVSPERMDVGKPNGVFGWHFWSQALVDGKWIDLDATMDGKYSVGHITSATSALETESMNADMVDILALIGNMEIEIVEIGK